MLTSAIKRIDHVAIVVAHLNEALSFYQDTLGLAPSDILDFPSEGVRIAFLPLGGESGSQIELLEPLSAETGVGRFLASHGAGLHHICLEVPDIDQALADLQSQGARVLDATPRKTAEGRGIFLHPKGTFGVLIELVQRMAGDSVTSA
ncbi:MAG TPA: methylmalonyl-CoA epimerase [Ktedonobacterales bacterium]